jgi:hypothetical protein
MHHHRQRRLPGRSVSAGFGRYPRSMQDCLTIFAYFSRSVRNNCSAYSSVPTSIAFPSLALLFRIYGVVAAALVHPLRS